MIRYPSGPLTPHAAYDLLKGRHPMMTLRAFDDSAEFSLLGAKALPDRTIPESVILQKNGLKGLVGPWDMIDQKGASEDGITNIDALHGPIEVEAKVRVSARDPKHLHRTVRDLIGSIHNKKTSELSFIDPDLGRWWADVRWFKGPPEAHKVGESRTQDLTLVLRADRGFWRTYNDVDSFMFAYEDMTDTFTVDHSATHDLGSVPQYYTGDGGGYCTSDGDQMIWVDDPADPFTTEARRVINGPWPGFTTDTNNQVVSQVHASFQEWSVPESARNIIGARMGDSGGSWNGNGVFVEYGANYLRLFYTIGFVETTLRSDPLTMLIPPFPGEKFTIVCGYEGDERLFKVLRNGGEIMSVKEIGTGSPLGSGNRGVGNGMFAAGALITQATPAAIRKISAGDNSTVSQSGFLRRINPGDQPMSDRYTVFGPGIFKFGNGPGSTEMIEFGPLLPNQVVLIDTSRQRPRIRDLTSIPPKPQELQWWQQAIKDFASFASAGNVPPLFRQIESAFGIVPPQGNLYSLLKGRWGKDAAIPPKTIGVPAQPYYVKVSIDDGNADSKILVAGTPLRRLPV